jgi:hypothetical protein
VDRATPGDIHHGGRLESDSTLYVGLNVHKDSITVAYALGRGEIELLGKIGMTRY